MSVVKAATRQPDVTTHDLLTPVLGAITTYQFVLTHHSKGLQVKVIVYGLDPV